MLCRNKLNCPNGLLGERPTEKAEQFLNHLNPIKGNVACALFYFAVRYETTISPEEEASLRRWHNDDPVDQEEMDRNNGIEKIQGNRNPFYPYARVS